MTKEEKKIIARLFKSYFIEDLENLPKDDEYTEDAKDIMEEIKADNPIITDKGLIPKYLKLYLLGAGRGFDLALRINSIAAETKDLYTIDEAAAAMRVSKQTVYNKIKQGKIKATKRGKSYIIQRQDIEPYIIGE